MKYCYVIFACVSCVLLNSCNQAMFVNGTYSGKNPHIFTFSKDSTFKYEHHDYCYSESFGTWDKNENFLYLNSFIQVDKIPLEYTKIKENKDSVIVINIEVNSQNEPQKDYICWPVVNGKPCFFDPERGSFSFRSEISIDSIYFQISKSPFIIRGTGSKMCYDDVKTKTIYPHLSVGENLNVTINVIDSLFGYKVFKDERLEIKSGKIILKDESKKYKLSLKK